MTVKRLHLQEEKPACSLASCGDPESQLYQPGLEELVTGCLEEAFWHMDSSALAARSEWTITGGSTALVALFICDRIFVANAGDSRAVVFRSKEEYRVRLVRYLHTSHCCLQTSPLVETRLSYFFSPSLMLVVSTPYESCI